MALSRNQIQVLLAKARDGDVEAFATVFEEYRSLLHRIACRLVGPHECDDVVMDTYIKVWRSIPRFRGSASIKTWLCKAARNCSLDYLRRRSRQEARRVEPADDEPTPVVERIPDSAENQPDEIAVQHDLRAMIDRAVGRLADHHRTAFLLREVDGLSYNEIAGATGVSVGTVMSRLFHARRYLRGFLKDLEP